MDNGQVPVHTYTSQEPNAAIQIQVEAEPCHLAEYISKDPFTLHEVVHHQKWQREQVQNIRNSKVENKHVDVPQFLPVVPQKLQAQSIGYQTDDEYRDVDRRQESACEVKVDLRTSFIHYLADGVSQTRFSLSFIWKQIYSLCDSQSISCSKSLPLFQ